MPDDPISFYDQNAVPYAADGSVNPRLSAFLDLMPPGGRILELGTGSGRDAKAIIEAGFTLDATDGSRELADLASAYIGQAVRIMRFDELSADGAYDGIYAAASLLHVPRSDLPAVVAKLHAALVPGGVVWASFKAGTDEGLDGLGRYYNYLDSDTLRSIFAANGIWTSLNIEAWAGSGYDNKPTDWVAISATK